MHRTIQKLSTTTKTKSLSKHLTKPNLVTKSILTQSDLQKLFTHEITALQIKSFYPPTYAQKLGQDLGNKAKDGQGDNWKVVTADRGLERSDVWTMGEYIPYNVAVATNRRDEYFDGVQSDLKKRRRQGFTSTCNDNDDDNNNNKEEEPYLWPLDQFRLELDETWLHGATLARDKDTGRPMGGGLPRIMLGPTRWKKGFIHADQFSPLSIDRGLFSANIYLNLPDRGSTNNDIDEGELHIWPLDIRKDLDWYENMDLLKGMTIQDASMQIKLRKELGTPLKIHVDPGDLVLLCVQRPHAAIGFKEGSRVSLQCFIQYHGFDDRLLIDI